jgi:hypothetical protein
MRSEIVTEMYICITMSSSFGDTQLTNSRGSVVGKLTGPHILQKPNDHYCVHKIVLTHILMAATNLILCIFFFSFEKALPHLVPRLTIHIHILAPIEVYGRLYFSLPKNTVVYWPDNRCLTPTVCFFVKSLRCLFWNVLCQSYTVYSQ